MAKKGSSYGVYGTSREAKPSEIFDDKQFAKNTWNEDPQRNLENPQGLIFGLIKNKPVIMPETTDIPNRNVLVIGPPGSGKTQGYIMTNIIHERERSIVVTDPKGEIYEATAELKRRQGYEVRLVNFKEMLISDRYNPIDYITREADAEQVATTIVMNAIQNSKMDFWDNAAIALLKTLLLYVKYEFPKEEATMAKVIEMLTVHCPEPEDMDQLFDRLDPNHPAYRSYRIVRMAQGKTRASIFISLGIYLSKFENDAVRWFTSKSDFHFDDIGKKKMVLYVILPVADPTWEPLISIFFSQLFQRLYDVADHHFNRLPVPVNFLLDEFPNLGKIPGFIDILATCRSYGISCSLIVQSLGQLIDKYNPESAEAILGNCALRFLLGVNDRLTAEYFSDLIGKTTVTIDNDGTSYIQRNLLMPDELLRMDRNTGILLVTGMNPIRLRKVFHFEFFKGILTGKSSRFDYFKTKPVEEQIRIAQEWEEIKNKKSEKVKKKSSYDDVWIPLTEFDMTGAKPLTPSDLLKTDHTEEKEDSIENKHKSLFRSSYGLASIYMELDKSKTSIIDITQKIFDAVDGFGYVDEIEVTTYSKGEDAYVERLNDQGVNFLDPLDEIKVATKAPTEEFISFVKQNSDIDQLSYSIGTACYIETGEKVLYDGAVKIDLYVDDDDWALYLKLNTDIFAPFYYVRNEQTEEMARKNAPKLKQFIDRLIQFLPVIDWEWEEVPDYLLDYLEQLHDWKSYVH